ncbi:MAG: hypothetical protein ACLUVC_13610 [Longibaculum sp.]
MEKIKNIDYQKSIAQMLSRIHNNDTLKKIYEYVEFQYIQED